MRQTPEEEPLSGPLRAGFASIRLAPFYPLCAAARGIQAPEWSHERS